MVSTLSHRLGFNAYGYGCADALKDDLPYVESWNDLVPISVHRLPDEFHYRDIFAPEVQQDIRDRIREKCFANRDNGNLIGYYWTDLPAWALENPHQTNWVKYMRGLPASAAGRQRYLAFLRESYADDLSRLNTAYGTKAASWADLARTTFPPGLAAPPADDRAFLRIIARQYYGLLGRATREFDPHHLILGDRLDLNPEPEVLEEMLPYVDVVAVQPPYAPGFPQQAFEELHHRAKNKPIIICDFAIRFRDGDKPVRGGQLAPDDRAAGEYYAEYVKEARRTGFIIGTFWCGLADSENRGKPGIKQGLLTGSHQGRPALDAQMTSLNRWLTENVTHLP